MRYFIKNETEILELIPELTIPLHLSEGESLLPIDDNVELSLPPEFYMRSVRPEYIKLRAANSFDVLADEFGKKQIYDMSIIWDDGQAFANIISKTSEYKVTQAAEDLSDVNSIIIGTMPEAINADDNREINIKIFGEDYICKLEAGQAKIAFNTVGHELYPIANILIDGQFLTAALNVPTNIVNMIELRRERDIKLRACDWLVIRHASQDTKTLSDADYAELKVYMQALRDLPATVDLNNIAWPTKPSFI